MPGRTGSAPGGDYRFGFNGKENDSETGTQDYGLRIYNPGLGKFLSVDPLFKGFPWNSTYAFAENDVIRCIDLEGGEKKPLTSKIYQQLARSYLNLVNSYETKYKNNPAMFRELNSNYIYAFEWAGTFLLNGRDFSAYNLSRYMEGRGGIDIFSYDKLNAGATHFRVWYGCGQLNSQFSLHLDDFARTASPGLYQDVVIDKQQGKQQGLGVVLGNDFSSASGSFELLARGTFDILVKEDGDYTIISGSIKYTFRDTYRWHPGESGWDGDYADHDKMESIKGVGAKEFFIRGYWEAGTSGSQGRLNVGTYEDSMDYSDHPDSYTNDIRTDYGKLPGSKVLNDFRKE